MPAPAPTSLPVEACLGPLRAALAGAGHAVLRAPPGAGKTTVVPLRLLDEPWLAGRRIVVLEPRRLATRAAARRMAFLLGQAVGTTVGYATRDERRSGPATRVEVVTEGILVRRLQHDPALPGVGLVVFDEVHERTLQSDLALALTLDVRASLRPDLRLLAMSATLDTEAVAALLGAPAGPAPVVASLGRQHPVEIRWRPSNGRRTTEDPVARVAVEVTAAIADDEGDVLVFLPGARQIRIVQAQLSGLLPPSVDILPLFGALTADEQDRALVGSRPGRRRVVLATDIAETSLTVDGVRIVVDAGLVRTPRYDRATGLTRLHTGPASQSATDQRAGRAGRQSPGVAYRLWSEADHGRRRRFPPAEITTVDLAGLVLELALWGVDAGRLGFLEPPPPAALAEGRALLVALGAIEEATGRPTTAGWAMADLPLHPRLARMVTGAARHGQGDVACALAALLEDRDIFRGHPDQVDTDVAERVRLVTGPGSASGQEPVPAEIDQAALSSARRRAASLRRRAGGAPASPGGACGPVLALAYPDRIAQARGGGRFRLRTGAGAWLAESDSLAREAWLVVAQLDAGHGDSRIRLAAALDAADVERAAGAAASTVTSLAWDDARRDLRATVTRTLDHLVLATTERKAGPGPETTAALLAHVRGAGLGALTWTPSAEAFRERVGFLRRLLGGEWPDLSDGALLARLDEWLAPLLAGATDRAALEAVDLGRALGGLLTRPQRAELDRLAPGSVPLSAHRRLPVDYGTDPPSSSVRLQEVFGVRGHPSVAGGRTPVVLHLLSPAGRPVQVTADLPGFWSGSYAEVRKEMAGRYPKHRWPLDPTTVLARSSDHR